MKLPRPTEHEEQVALAQLLTRAGLLWCAVPNGARTSMRTAVRLKREGLHAGVPDVLIFDPPPGTRYVGACVELKRAGAPPSAVSVAQREWLAMLAGRGWLAIVGYGWQDAAAKLRAAGYIGMGVTR